MPRLFLVATVAALGLFAFAASACSSVGLSPIEHVRAAQEASMDEPFAFEMKMEVEDETFGSLDVTATGKQDLANDLVYLEMETFGIEVEAILHGANFYMRMGGLFAGVDKWVKFDYEELTGFSMEDLGFTGSDPSSFLATLAGVSEDGIEDLGEEEIDGVETSHYRVEIDPELALAELEAGDEELQQLLEKSLEMFDGSYFADLWIDEDDRLRRMTFDLEIDGQAASYVMDFFDYGEPVDIDIPADDEVVSLDEWTAGFEDLFGSLFGEGLDEGVETE